VRPTYASAQVGGRLVYSTCSFNPVENEAVVAAVLQATKGAMKLLDVSDALPALRRRAGLQTWRVKDGSGWYADWDDVRERVAEGKSKFDPTMFPPPPPAREALSRCMRFLPHDQDTGGFFVAVLEKAAECADLEMPSAAHRPQNVAKRVRAVCAVCCGRSVAFRSAIAQQRPRAQPA
jgi:16S rRNA C967 or C1407 C5-methylase (RsmB/RsmF family)